MALDPSVTEQFIAAVDASVFAHGIAMISELLVDLGELPPKTITVRSSNRWLEFECVRAVT